MMKEMEMSFFGKVFRNRCLRCDNMKPCLFLLVLFFFKSRGAREVTSNNLSF